MRQSKLKYLIIAFAIVTLLFFSNDFGLIDVEKEAIITAVAIDFDKNGKYEVTVQIAVPEAANTKTENSKAQITGHGDTIGSAIKNTGDVSGWYPQLAFCNLIIIGDEVAQTDIIKVLDYFAKTLRIQDSAQIVLAENKAKELLEKTTPLDNISSFALQKILFKNPGFDTDVATNDIKTFCAGYYSDSASSFMPMIKVLTKTGEEQPSNSSKQNQSSSGEQSGGQQTSSESDKGQNFFDASYTALFYKGKKVGELNTDLTHSFNMLWRNVKGTTIPVSYAKTEGGELENYLLKVLRCTPKIKVKADEKNISMSISVDLYCKISDHNADDHNASLSNNKPLPDKLVKQAQTMLEQNLLELFETSRQTGCDFLKIKEKIYRFSHKHYARYKDVFLDRITPEVKVTVSGQK